MVFINWSGLPTCAFYSNITSQCKHLHFHLKDWAISCSSILSVITVQHMMFLTLSLSAASLFSQGRVKKRKWFSCLLLFLLSCTQHSILHFQFCMLYPDIVLEKILWRLFMFPCHSSEWIFIIFWGFSLKKTNPTKQPGGWSTCSCTFWRYFQLRFQL